MCIVYNDIWYSAQIKAESIGTPVFQLRTGANTYSVSCFVSRHTFCWDFNFIWTISVFSIIIIQQSLEKFAPTFTGGVIWWKTHTGPGHGSIWNVMLVEEHSLLEEHWKGLVCCFAPKGFSFKFLIVDDFHLMNLKHTATVLYTSVNRCSDWLKALWLTPQTGSPFLLLWHHQDSNWSPPDDRAKP